MSDDSFDMDEFMKPPEQPVVQIAELDVQKAVVEELAAEKVVLHENISSLQTRVSSLSSELENARKEIEARDAEIDKAKKSLDEASSAMAKKDAEIAELQRKLSDANSRIVELDAKVSEKLMAEFDRQERNPNALALLDREMELPDRFPGETRDHVIEVIKEARDAAEKEGRRRRAQLLEGVLVANEPCGGLAKKRSALEKFFKDNGYVMNGIVIAELERCGIQYKDGDQYLLPKEILLRTY